MVAAIAAAGAPGEEEEEKTLEGWPGPDAGAGCRRRFVDRGVHGEVARVQQGHVDDAPQLLPEGAAVEQHCHH